MSEDNRRYFAAVSRNRDYILAVLRRVLPARATVLEVASGSGEHAIYFAEHLPGVTWLPTDADHELLASINAWREATPAANVRPAKWLDVTQQPWPTIEADAVVNINMLQVSPWTACDALFRGASSVLRPGGIMVMYGPYRREGKHTSASNASFDAAVKEKNPLWGVRNLEDVVAVAKTHGLNLDEVIDMPANNLAVVYRASRVAEAPG